MYLVVFFQTEENSVENSDRNPSFHQLPRIIIVYYSFNTILGAERQFIVLERSAGALGCGRRQVQGPDKREDDNVAEKIKFRRIVMIFLVPVILLSKHFNLYTFNMCNGLCL